MLRALTSGGGVALMRSGLIESELAEGSVVRLFDTTTRPPGAYYLVYARQRPMSASFTAFRDWLFEEARAYRESVAHLV